MVRTIDGKPRPFGDDKKKISISDASTNGSIIKKQGSFVVKISPNRLSEYVIQGRNRVTPSKVDVERNQTVNKKIIDGVNDYLERNNLKNKVSFVETQGSFAKGTDLAGTSDLDIFIGFKYDTPLSEIRSIPVQIGQSVIKPIASDYKLKTGADDKKYPEAMIPEMGKDVEVQLLGVADVTPEQVEFSRNKYPIEGGMKTAQDRSPHHTRYMINALRGKENDVRLLKEFMKDTGVYDSSGKSRGFSGYSTEVLIDKLGSFENVLKFFANFKPTQIGEYKGAEKTPLTLVDPIDPYRNLGSAFSEDDKVSSARKNRKLARMIKVSQEFLGNLQKSKPKKEDLESVSLSIKTSDTDADENEMYTKLYSLATNIQNKLNKEGFKVKSPHIKLTDNFEADVPRVNVNYDEKTRTAKIDFGLENFKIDKYRKDNGIPLNSPNPKMTQEDWNKTIQTYRRQNIGKNMIEEGGKLKAVKEVKNTDARGYLQNLLSNEIDTVKIEPKFRSDVNKGIVGYGISKFEDI
jgi:tRNA nucleotidyltransferase (CCA-adding enzyme)